VRSLHFPLLTGKQKGPIEGVVHVADSGRAFLCSHIGLVFYSRSHPSETKPRHWNIREPTPRFHSHSWNNIGTDEITFFMVYFFRFMDDTNGTSVHVLTSLWLWKGWLVTIKPTVIILMESDLIAKKKKITKNLGILYRSRILKSTNQTREISTYWEH
jgi:hypothetical protein